MNKGVNSVYVIVALVATSFAAGRFYADSALREENHKLKESVSLLRGEKMGVVRAESGFHFWQDEQRPTQIALAPTAAPAHAPEVKSPPAVETPRVASASAPAGEATKVEAAMHDAPAKGMATPRLEAEPAIPQEAPQAVSASPVANGKKTSKKWVSDLGDNVQGTATYWHCNNATLVASGMEYYAYGSVPASRLKKPDDAYSVRDGKAIVISGCWSPRLEKAILYRKSDGQQWEPNFHLDDGSWTLVVE